MLIGFGVFSVSKIEADSLSSILVNMVPPSPAPNENVSVTLSSYADNLDSVLISWSVNGKNVVSGIGKKSFSVTAPALGSESTVLAKINLPSGQEETKIIIKPSTMVLLFEANDSYVPPFYKGKALPVVDSEIKIVAMPEIRTSSGLVNPKNMTYSWKKDYTNDVEASGYGKNYFTYTSDYLDDSSNIEVTASTLDQKYSVRGSINVGAIQPKILFYKNDGTLGPLWEEAFLQGHQIQDKDVVIAEPYFISPKEIRSPRLTWNWFINGQNVLIQGFKKNLMPLQVEEGVSGVSSLKLEIENRDKIFQTVGKEIELEF